MRVSKETAAAHRGAIVAAAGRLFRAHGVAGVAVAEITRACGLTHGGFYGHFASKEALAAEAIAGAFAEGLARLEAAADLATYVRIYLSRSHRVAPTRATDADHLPVGAHLTLVPTTPVLATLSRLP